MWYTHTHTRRESETQQQLISLQTFSCWREMKRVQAVCNIYLSFPHWNGQHGGPSHYHETAVNKNSKIKQSVPSLPAQSAHLLPCYFHATPQLGWKKPKTAHTPTQGCVGFLHCSVHQCTRQTRRQRQHLKCISLGSVLEKRQFVTEL